MLTITYKSLTGLEIPSNQGLLKLNYDTQSSEVRSSEVTDSNLSLILAPENQDDDSVICWLKGLIQRPVIVSVIESVISKDKKGKESEKQTLLGQTSVDLLPFLVSRESKSVCRCVLCGLGGDGFFFDFFIFFIKIHHARQRPPKSPY